MANNLGEDINQKHVILKEKYYHGDTINRVFLALGGFGCSPDTMGSAVIGTLESTGENFRAEGYEIERFATEEEVKESKRLLFENRIYHI